MQYIYYKLSNCLLLDLISVVCELLTDMKSAEVGLESKGKRHAQVG